MQGDELPPDDHILRHVPRKNLAAEPDGTLKGYILPEALQARDREAFLSVQWVEFDPQSSDHVTAAVQALRNVRTTTNSSVFAKARVGTVTAVCASHSPTIPVRVLHEPRERNPAHAGIHGLPPGDKVLLQSLAAKAFVDLIRNADVP